MKSEQILGLVNPLIALVLATTFFILWTRQYRRSYILAIAFSYLMLGTGFLVSHLAKEANGLVHSLGTHIFYSFGIIAIVWAVCKRAQTRLPFKILLVMSVVTGIYMITYPYNGAPSNMRLLVSNTTYGLMFVVGAYCIFGNCKKGAIEKVVFIMFVLTALQFFIRPAVTLHLEGIVDTVNYRDSIYYSILNVTIAILSLMLAISLIAACALDIVTELRTQSERDLLSGLKIRRVFEQDAVGLFEKQGQTGLPASLIVADIDYFKNVNDNYGHQIGDRVIEEFGRLLNQFVREGDLAGRVGGEEFCLILWNSDAEAARLIAETARTVFSQTPIEGLPRGHFLTASFGVAEAITGEGYDQVFSRADKALYRSKNCGRDRVTCDHQMAPVQSIYNSAA